MFLYLVLPTILIAVGFFTDWNTVRLIDAWWAYNSLMIGGALWLYRRKEPISISGWSLLAMFGFTFAWPIVRIEFPAGLSCWV